MFPCPRSRLRIWCHGTGWAVPSRVSLLISIILRLNLVLTHGIPPDFRGGVYLFIPPYVIGSVPSYRVTQLRPDGVHCRESAGTGPVVRKVVPATGAAFAGQVPMDQTRPDFEVSMHRCNLIQAENAKHVALHLVHCMMMPSFRGVLFQEDNKKIDI